MDFNAKLGSWVELVNKTLEVCLSRKEAPEKHIYEAMKYSLMAGGKRLRPVLALAVCEMLGGEEEDILPFACALEMIHTYSLIHDDLPAMDNDDYRRGRLTNHKVFGEAMAILAGDALLNLSFEIMLNHVARSTDNVLNKVKAMAAIAEASGTAGMIGGQVVDLESEGKEIPEETLRYMHRCKTGALIKAPVKAAAIICSVDQHNLDSLERFAEDIGLGFQIKDDILDVEGDSKLLGKKTGSDEKNKKSTFISIYGMEESKRMLQEITGQAVRHLDRFGERAGFLKALAEYLLNRDH